LFGEAPSETPDASTRSPDAGFIERDAEVTKDVAVVDARRDVETPRDTGPDVVTTPPVKVSCGVTASGSAVECTRPDYCCATAGSGGRRYACTTANQSCQGTRIQCGEPSDCPSGEVCCGELTDNGYTQVTCRAKCENTQQVTAVTFCDRTKKLCDDGRTECRESTSLPGFYVCR
jgi:hypothetical protein